MRCSPQVRCRAKEKQKDSRAVWQDSAIPFLHLTEHLSWPRSYLGMQRTGHRKRSVIKHDISHHPVIFQKGNEGIEPSEEFWTAFSLTPSCKWDSFLKCDTNGQRALKGHWKPGGNGRAGGFILVSISWKCKNNPHQKKKNATVCLSFSLLDSFMNYIVNIMT